LLTTRTEIDRHVVEEGLAVDLAHADPAFDRRVKRVAEHADRVVEVQPEVKREVVPGTEGQRQHRQVVGHRDVGHGRQGPVSTGAHEQFGALGDLGLDHLGERVAALQCDHLDSARLGPGDQVVNAAGTPRVGVREQY
jgi:hypothetical protein